jgi:DNA invertase Pin-like site-specific DNA recombinase
MSNRPTIRCAIYTRKSTEEGLEQDFNSLHAQREACEAYIKSQRHEGWVLVKATYDDGGYSGGSMERPALKKLLDDVTAQKVDIIIVYKVDRLTRSLADFAKIVETFDAHKVSFVSVTQQFNTTTSMGRLTLNVLLSFAQFEREVTGERIRDKIAASKKKGIWMGGMPPPGYRVKNRQLVVHKKEAEIVRQIFTLYNRLGNVCALHEKLQKDKVVRPSAVTSTGYRYGGGLFSRGMLYKLLSNPLYVGEVRHSDQNYPGEHQSIIERKLWDRTQRTLATNAHDYHTGKDAADPTLLAGLLRDASGNRFKADHTRRGSKRYRYYVSVDTNGSKSLRVSAHEIEHALLTSLSQLLRDRTHLVKLIKARSSSVDLPTAIRFASASSEKLKSGLPHEKREILLQLLNRVTFNKKKLLVEIKRDAFFGIASSASKSAFTIEIPVSLKQRGVETRLIIEGEETPHNRDAALIKTIARATSWFDDLATGRVKDFSELGRKERLTRSVVGRICSLAFLSPELIEHVMAGRQALNVRTRNLLREVSLPESWSEQRKIFVG